MGKAGKPRKKKRRRSPPPKKKKGGVLMGMRSGFKNVAHSVAGVGEEPVAKPSKRGKILSTAVTVLLVAAAAALLYRRFG